LILSILSNPTKGCILLLIQQMTTQPSQLIYFYTSIYHVRILTRCVYIIINNNIMYEILTFNDDNCPFACFRYCAKILVGNVQTLSRICTTFTNATYKPMTNNYIYQYMNIKLPMYNICVKNNIRYLLQVMLHIIIATFIKVIL